MCRAWLVVNDTVMNNVRNMSVCKCKSATCILEVEWWYWPRYMTQYGRMKIDLAGRRVTESAGIFKIE